MFNILHIIESLEFGGAEKVVVHLANKLCHDNNITICVTKRLGELCNQLDSRIKVICLDGKEGNDLSIPFKLVKILKKYNINIIHTHDWGIYLEAVFASTLYRKSKIIHTVHGSYIPYRLSKLAQLKKKIRHFLERIASYNVYKIVPVSTSIKNYIEKDIRINGNKLLIIHNGIEGHKSEQLDVSSTSVLKLITVGRLATVKNHKLMIDALSCALNKGNNVSLTIVGDGPEYKKLIDYTTNLNIADNVVFKGFRTDIYKLLTKHHVFILSSDYEGISIALLEAMSVGLPAISTNVGGIPDTIVDQKTGILVNERDSGEMCKAIIQLASNFSDVKSMGYNAQNYFREYFHENVVLDKYNSLYRECMK